ncbi:MAG: choice-of-anchor L domain-containing protein [Bacteroidota bacterium]
MKKTLLTVFSLVFTFVGFAQLSVSPNQTAANLANYLLGTGVTISNASMTCPTNANAFFSNGSSTNLGINNGILLTTGSAAAAAGNAAGNDARWGNGAPGIAAMTPLTGSSSSYDGCLLQFDIVPRCSPLSIKYKFGSEEYTEFVNMGFNDAFGFFISGPDPGGGNYTNVNLAKVPGTGQTVNIDNINPGTNSVYYVAGSGPHIEYDGLTTLLTGTAAVVPCQSYHLVLAIVDGGDNDYDSGVFLEQSGISCNAPNVTASSTAGGGSGGTICAGQSVTLTASGATDYDWSTGATTNSIVVSPSSTTVYTVGGSNIGVCIQSSITLTVTVNPAPTAVAGPAKVLSCSQTTTVLAGSGGGTYSWSGPGIVSGGTTATPTVNATGTYSLIVTSSTSPFCPSVVSTVAVTANTTPPSPTASSTGTLNCTNTTVSLNATGGGTYSWSGTGIVSGGATANPVVNGTGPYVVTVTAANGCTATANTSVAQNTTPPSPTASSSTTLTCSAPTAVLSASGGGTYSWSGTGIVSGANTANPTVNGTGPYVVTVTGSNGCTATANTSVAQNTTPPSPTASSSTTLTCSAPTAVLSASGGGTYSWSGTGIVSGGNTATPTVNGTGPYVVTVTAANGCTATANTTVAQNTTPPSPTASNTATLTCATTTAALTATGGGTYFWSGTGILSGNTTANPVVNGTGPYVVTVTAANGCTATANTTVAQNMTPPSPTASNTATLTCSTTTAALTATGGGTYNWSGTGIVSGGTTANPVVNGTGPYIVTVTAANGCTATANTSVAQNTTAPSPSASSSGSLTCSTTTVTLTGTTGGTYVWSGPGIVSGGTTSTPDVNQTGTYIVTVTAVNGCTATASTSVGQNTVTPTVTMPVTQTITCASPTVSLAGSANPSNSTPVWTGGACAGATTFTASACSPGTYTLTVTNPVNGCINTGMVDVVPSNGIPSVTLATNGSITCNTTTAEVTATTTMSPVSYAWSGPGAVTGAATPAGTVTVGGTYQCVVTNTMTGCSSTITTVVPTNTTPVIPSVAPAASITCVTNTVALSATPTGTNYAYSWSGPGTITNGTTNNPTVDASGNYVVTMTDNINGCVGSFTVNVPSNTTTPTFTLGSASSVTTTCAAPNATLSATSSTDPNTIYTWTTPSASTITGTPIFVSAAGIYTVVVTNTVNGCNTSSALSQATVEVIADSGIPVVTLASNSLSITCTNPTPSVAVTTTASPVSYNWTPTSGIVPGTETTANPVFNAAGSYSVIVTNTVSSCATSANANVVTVVLDNTPPVLSLSAATNDGTITCTNTQVTITPTVTPSTNLTYTWSPGGVTSSSLSNATFTTAAIYTLAVTNTLTGCVSSSTNTANTFTVYQNNTPPTSTITAISTNSVIGCGANNSTVTLSGVSSSTNTTQTWLPGLETTTTLDVTTAGTYTLVVLDAVSGCSVTNQYVVNGGSTPPQNVSAGNSAAIPCGTPTVALNGTTTSTDVVTYDWSGPNAGSIVSGSNTQNPVVMDQGIYTLTVTNTASGCTATATINVTQANVTAAFSANPTSGLSPLNVNFTDASIGATGIGYSWNFGDSNTSNAQHPAHTFTTGTYTVILTVSSGPCTDTASVVIVVEDGLTLEIPNVFTPNGDGSNEFFSIKSTGVKEISLQIFNRWGQKLHEFTGPKASWDGLTPNGAEVPEGTYFYFVKATGFDDAEIEKHGSVNLFR